MGAVAGNDTTAGQPSGGLAGAMGNNTTAAQPAPADGALRQWATLATATES
ncbi:MAG: hypothetical protein HC828_11515 [Blastochloris sp.]|nr:hypothetical protein [Blastochloris sp.]